MKVDEAFVGMPRRGQLPNAGRRSACRQGGTIAAGCSAPRRRRPERCPACPALAAAHTPQTNGRCRECATARRRPRRWSSPQASPDPRWCRRHGWTSCCIARAFWRLNPSSRIDSSGTSARSAAAGNACSTASVINKLRPESLRQPVQQQDSQIQGHLLAGDRIDQSLEDGRKARRAHPAEPLDQRTDDRVVAGQLVEGLQIDR